MIRRRTDSRKWWYLRLKCLVRGVSFGDFATSRAPELSSNTLQNTVGAVLIVLILLVFISSMRLRIGITVVRDCDKLMYSASIVLRAHCVCNFDCHTMGQPVYKIMYPVRDFVVLTSSTAVFIFQFPGKTASAKTSKDCFLSGLSIIPLFLVFIRYFIRCSASRPWEFLGSSQNRVYWWVA